MNDILSAAAGSGGIFSPEPRGGPTWQEHHAQLDELIAQLHARAWVAAGGVGACSKAAPVTVPAESAGVCVGGRSLVTQPSPSPAPSLEREATPSKDNFTYWQHQALPATAAVPRQEAAQFSRSQRPWQQATEPLLVSLWPAVPPTGMIHDERWTAEESPRLANAAGFQTACHPRQPPPAPCAPPHMQTPAPSPGSSVMQTPGYQTPRAGYGGSCQSPRSGAVTPLLLGGRRPPAGIAVRPETPQPALLPRQPLHETSTPSEMFRQDAEGTGFDHELLQAAVGISQALDSLKDGWSHWLASGSRPAVRSTLEEPKQRLDEQILPCSGKSVSHNHDLQQRHIFSPHQPQAHQQPQPQLGQQSFQQRDLCQQKQYIAEKSLPQLPNHQFEGRKWDHEHQQEQMEREHREQWVHEQAEQCKHMEQLKRDQQLELEQLRRDQQKQLQKLWVSQAGNASTSWLPLTPPLPSGPMPAPVQSLGLAPVGCGSTEQQITAAFPCESTGSRRSSRSQAQRPPSPAPLPPSPSQVLPASSWAWPVRASEEPAPEEPCTPQLPRNEATPVDMKAQSQRPRNRACRVLARSLAAASLQGLRPIWRAWRLEALHRAKLRIACFGAVRRGLSRLEAARHILSCCWTSWADAVHPARLGQGESRGASSLQRIETCRKPRRQRINAAMLLARRQLEVPLFGLTTVFSAWASRLACRKQSETSSAELQRLIDHRAAVRKRVVMLLAGATPGA